MKISILNAKRYCGDTTLGFTWSKGIFRIATPWFHIVFMEY